MRLIVGLLLLLVSGIVRAQPDSDVQDKLRDLDSQGRTLAGVQLLLDALAADKSPDVQRQLKIQLSQQMPFAGQYSRAINAFESIVTIKASAGDGLSEGELAQLTPIPALDAIAAEARKHRIVVVNEAHDSGATRAFNRRVVRALADQGYRTLAMEALQPNIEQANRDHRITRKLGFYSQDPVYAAIMRSAWAAGYKLLNYEDEKRDYEADSQGRNSATACDAKANLDWVTKVKVLPDVPQGAEQLVREKHQACNLATAFGKLPAGAKMIVIVGHAHVRKTQGWDGIEDAQGNARLRWMTGFLTAFTGEDILAIDQTEQDIAAKAAEADPAVKQIYQKFAPTAETVLRRPDGGYFLPKSLDNSVDMAVFRPNPRDKDNWWLADDELLETILDAPNKEVGWPMGLMMALPSGSNPADIVPLDHFYIWKPNMKEIRLLLPKGPADIWLDLGHADAVKIGTIQIAGDGNSHPALRLAVETETRALDQVRMLSPRERIPALASLREQGKLPPPQTEVLGSFNSTARQCPSVEVSLRAVDVRAAQSSASGIDFLVAEIEGEDLTVEAQARLKAASDKPAQSDDPLLAELFLRRDKDQAIRLAFTDSLKKTMSVVGRQIFSSKSATFMCLIDQEDTAWLKEQLARIGWFDARKYGEKADAAAWLMVQHADNDPEFQVQVLQTLTTLVEAGGTSKMNYAYLFDRVAMHQNQPQRYGTQGSCVGKSWEPRPSENPEDLDKRRAEMGLPPEDQYRSRFTCAPPG